MTWQGLRIAFSMLIACMVFSSVAMVSAAPRIDRVSLRGLQAGGITTFSIDGAELLPEPVLHFDLPAVSYKIKEGATAEHLDVEVSIDGACANGIYLLRAASATGISEPVAVGIDNLAQLEFVPEVSTTNVALTGQLSGSTISTLQFSGKQGQQVVVELEARRLGSKLDPVIHLYDARHTQLAWSRGLAALGGDPRMTVTLPADGKYQIEIHDAVFRGATPGFFRLKVGDFKFADLVFPLGVQKGAEASFEFLGSNLAADVRAAGKFDLVYGLARDVQPAPWPDMAMLSGTRPALIVSDHAEVVEAAPTDKPQAIPAAPVAVNGRISEKGQQDRYRLEVTPGAKLQIDVLAHRRGSELDGVLSVQNEQGAELAASDDRADTSDPGLEFTVPEGVSAVMLVLRDLRGAGGPGFVYRLEVRPAGASFALSVADDRIHIPRDGAAIVRVGVQRSGYPGPIDLMFPNLPQSVSVTGNSIPPRATEAFVTLSAPGLSPSQAITPLIGTSVGDKLTLARRASTPGSEVTRDQPWLGDSLAIAVTPPAPLQLVWDLYQSDAQLIQGTQLANRVRIERAEGIQGAVRLSLLTTQRMPRKKVKENNQEREVDDIDRALRFAAETVVAPDAADAAPTIIVPGDLARIQYDLAIQAELLGEDGKSPIATIVTPARRLSTIAPIKLELAATTLEARAGIGSTGSLTGKVTRAPGFSLPVQITLSGLPDGVPAPAINLAADQTEFNVPVSFPYGTVAGAVPNVKVSALCLTDLQDPKTAVHTSSLDLALSIVPGAKPPEQPHVLFEDQPEFVATLTHGGGTAALDESQKYAGAVSLRVTPDQKYNPAIPGWELKIRANPGPGEFRYLRFAWKKQGGTAICLQLNHEGQWGPTAPGAASFRYHAGPAGPCYGASLTIDAALPEDWEIVTRDLFADFGEFTLTGMALSPIDGEFGLFDHIYLGTSVDDFRLVKP